ncbi:transcriptional regulator, ArgR [Plesiocystis pacifica SIR-1]|uniref:Arginine repressor n=1 Tax=Plesiocystis pacifica SIR-1 TaxID=391625 RepID=A6GEW8_9BACT|nr:transcriptional regulator, ArgR [Plesiocystis pacifica]EDM75560.1 transcriptional regulator, ArgR [Plesiocystis pacifica SIR-1]
MSATKERRKTLRQLLLSGLGGSTQAQLADALAERGIVTTQSTISRDLKLLGAQRRIREDGSFVYRLETGGRTSFPSGMVLAVEFNEVMIVVRTRVGRAPAVGIELDGLRHPDILGTVAGDDTVLVVPRSTRHIERLARVLIELAELA